MISNTPFHVICTAAKPRCTSNNESAVTLHGGPEPVSLRFIAMFPFYTVHDTMWLLTLVLLITIIPLIRYRASNLCNELINTFNARLVN